MDASAWYKEPEVGDMIFFDRGSGISHVGIVEDIDGCITTIEGNAGDMVQRKWYDLIILILQDSEDRVMMEQGRGRRNTRRPRTNRENC